MELPKKYYLVHQAKVFLCGNKPDIEQLLKEFVCLFVSKGVGRVQFGQLGCQFLGSPAQSVVSESNIT